MGISKTKDLKKRIDDTKQCIAKLFIDQCQNGAQSKEMEDFKAAACGQFIGEEAKNCKQRGLHGTAAALRVLAEMNTAESRTLIPKIVTYLEKREEIEIYLQKDEHKARQKCDLDSKNTIKISEILYTLSLIGPGVQSTESLAKKLAEQLIGSMREGKGWSYFIDDENGPELLPTAYAILALSANDYSQAEDATKFLISALEGRYTGNETERKERDADVNVDIACLYAITFSKVNIERDKLKIVFKSIWQKLKPLLSYSIEQNIEYSYKKKKNCYVRIPWQLYLIALSIQYDFKWVFSSSAIQNKLYHIMDMVKSGGLIYQHSGKKISARTNSVLFEVLSILKEKLAHRKVFWLCKIKDIAVYFVRHKVIRALAFIILSLLTVYFIYKWYREGTIADLGANLVAAIVWGSLLLIVSKK